VIFGDIVNTDLSNEIDVVSDMSLEARNLLSQIWRGSLFNQIATVQLPSNATPFLERYNDHIGGVSLTLLITVMEDMNACPMYDLPEPSSTPVCVPDPTPSATPSPTPTPTPEPTPITQISLIGDFNSWSEDVYLTSVDDVNWTISNWTPNTSGSLKIRANSSWDMSWAGEALPSGTAELNPQFSFYIVNGLYNVSFNSNTYEYSFIEVI
jgi:hypothetical protein